MLSLKRTCCVYNYQPTKLPRNSIDKLKLKIITLFTVALLPRSIQTFPCGHLYQAVTFIKWLFVLLL